MAALGGEDEEGEDLEEGGRSPLSLSRQNTAVFFITAPIIILLILILLLALTSDKLNKISN